MLKRYTSVEKRQAKEIVCSNNLETMKIEHLRSPVLLHLLLDFKCKLWRRQKLGLKKFRESGKKSFQCIIWFLSVI